MKGLFSLISKAINYIISYLSQGNRTHRQLQCIESKATHFFREISGYHLSQSERLSHSQLEEVFLPESQGVGSAWNKLCNLKKDMRYSAILLWIWAGEHGKRITFTGFPQFS